MKNLKKLSAAFMLAALLSSSLTSCIDNEVSPLVESIYANQAELLAAQAAVQNANATLVLAQAAVQEANAANQAAITAAFVASSAQDLLEQIAETELAVEEARLAMLLAQADFDRDMAQILASIRTAQNNEAGQHAADYVTAMGQIATLNGTKLTTQQSIATKELYMKSVAAGMEMTWEVYLAGLERDVLAKQASVTSNEEFIVRANAYLAGDYADMVEALAVATAAQTAKQAEIDALNAEDAQIDADILATTGNFDQFQADFVTMEGELATLKTDLATQEGIVETLTTVTIPAIETAIADYAGTTTTLTAAETAADAAEAAAQADIDAAELALGTETLPAPVAGDTALTGTTLYDLHWNALLVLADANKVLADLNADLALLNASYNDPVTGAIAVFAAAQATYDSGAAGLAAAKASADAALAAGEALVITTDADYVAAKAVFEADPTGNTLLSAGPDGLAGDPNDAATSYIYVSAVGVYPIANTTMMSTVVPPASPLTGAALPLEDIYDNVLFGTPGGPAVANDVAVAGDYYDVEADDVIDTNVNIYNATVTARTAALDAIAGLEAAVQTAQDNIDNADTILADALAAYNVVKDLYENQLTKVADAQAVVDAATTAVGTASPAAGTAGNVATAMAALGTVVLPAAAAGDTAIATPVTLFELLWNAELAALDATAAKDLHLATTLATYEANLVTEQANLVAANNMISEINILIVRKTADIAALQAEYDALVATPLYAAQQVRLLEIADELAVLNAEKAVIDAEVTALAVVVSFEGLASVTAIETAIGTAQGVINGAPAYYDMKAAQIAAGEVSVANLEAEVEKLKADLVDLDARIAAKTVEAEGYLALLNAALGN